MIEINSERKKEISSFSLPSYREIPSVGLYLDQTSKYISECLKVIGGCELTNSMIANYVKKKLIANPVKKQYYRDQIAELIFIALCKRVLSLEEIAKVFVLQKKMGDTRQAYELFKDCFERYLPLIFANKEAPVEDRNSEISLLNNIVSTTIRQIYLTELLSQSEND